MKKLANKWLLVYLFIPLLIINFLATGENHYIFLAHSLLNGSFSFIKTPPTLMDVAVFNGKLFWTNGPFPSIMLLPFVVLFGTNFQESFIKFPLNVLNFWFVYQISKSLKLSSPKAILLAIFYIFGSTYTPISIMPFSVYFSAVVTNTLLLFTVYEFFTRRRWLLIGIALASAILTRFTPILASIFFAMFLIGRQFRLVNIAKLSLPVLAALIFLGYYNHARFGSILETGHRFQIIPEEAALRRDYGLFSPKHIPANLYYMLIKTPDPILSDSTYVLKPPFLRTDYYGLSIFFMSPVLFLMFRSNFKDRFVKASSITILAMLVPIVTHYGIGYRQVGYWHALDFFPFLLIPLISSVKKISETTLTILVIAGIIITWFFTIEMLLGV